MNFPNHAEIYDTNVLKLLGISPIIHSLEEADFIHHLICNYSTRTCGDQYVPYYRGEQKYDWDITPNLFRNKILTIQPHDGKNFEQDAADEFVRTIRKTCGNKILRKIFEHEEYGEKWNALFQAQHAGVKTTLIDWTMRIDRAMYFCVEKSKDEEIEQSDGQLWLYLTPKQDIIGDKSYNLNPQKLETSKMLRVTVDIDGLNDRLLEQRINNQFGAFYISAHDKCNRPLNKQPDIAANLFRFQIPSNCKIKIRECLAKRHLDWNAIYIREMEPEIQEIIDNINSNIKKKIIGK